MIFYKALKTIWRLYLAIKTNFFIFDERGAGYRSTKVRRQEEQLLTV